MHLYLRQVEHLVVELFYFKIGNWFCPETTLRKAWFEEKLFLKHHLTSSLSDEKHFIRAN